MDSDRFYDLIIAALFRDIGGFSISSGEKYSADKIDGINQQVLTGTNRKYALSSYFFIYDLPKIVDKKISLENAAKLAANSFYPEMDEEKIINFAASVITGDIGSDYYNQDSKKSYLRSIFDEIRLGEKGPIGEHYYRLKKLEGKNEIIPIDKKELQAENRIAEEYSILFDEMKAHLGKLKSGGHLQFIADLQSALETFAWSVPSPISGFVSLYDYSATNSAIASALFKYAENEKNGSGNDINQYLNYDKKQYLLVSGALSGIQNFIFSYQSGSAKGLSKVLRAKSFFLSAITDLFSIYLLNECGYTTINRVLDAGGNFMLLLDNSDKTNNNLIRIEKEINEWLQETFQSDISFALVRMELCAKNLRAQKTNQRQTDDMGFAKSYMELGNLLQKAKYNRLHSVLTENGKWKEDSSFILPYEIESNQERCAFCHVRKKTESIDDEEEICELCKNFKDMGSKLAKEKSYYAIYFENNEPLNPDITILTSNVKDERDKGKVYLKLLDNRDTSSDLIFSINERFDEGTIIKTIPSYVPKDSKGNILTFEEISKNRKTKESISPQKSDIKEEIGETFLAALKCDLDDFGQIITLGFEEISIAHLACFSRMTDLFFKGYLQEAMKGELVADEYGKDGDKHRFEDIYTIFAGGDDMLLIGPWDTMIDFARFTQEKFMKFTGGNTALTISAGINLFKPRQPISFAVEKADELLDLSKNPPRYKEEPFNNEKSKYEAKNRLTLFSTTVKWEEVNDLMQFAYKLNDNMKNPDQKDGISDSFLFRLLKYHQMYVKSLEQEENYELENCLWRAHLSYDIGRNLIAHEKSRKDKEIESEKGRYDFLKSLYIKDPEKSNLMRNLKIPLFWTIYKNRKTKIKEGDK